MIIQDVTEEYFNNAKPGVGRLEHDMHTEEADRKITELLYKTFGGDIRTLEIEQVEKRHLKTPDAIWNGVYWEYKSVSNKSSINDRMKDAWRKQRDFAQRRNIEDKPIGLLFDISRKKQSVDKTVEMICAELCKRVMSPVDIIIKDGDEVIRVFRKQ